MPYGCRSGNMCGHTELVPLNALILAMATAIAPVSSGKAVAKELLGVTVLSPNITSFLGSQNNIAGRPKAYPQRQRGQVQKHCVYEKNDFRTNGNC